MTQFPRKSSVLPSQLGSDGYHARHRGGWEVPTARAAHETGKTDPLHPYCETVQTMGAVYGGESLYISKISFLLHQANKAIFNRLIRQFCAV